MILFTKQKLSLRRSKQTYGFQGGGCGGINWGFGVDIHTLLCINKGFLVAREDPLEKAMAPHSSTLAWKIPRMEEPGGLQSMGSQSWTRLSDFTFTFLFLVVQRVNNLLPCQRSGFNLWVRKIPWDKGMATILIFSPGEFQGQRSFESYSPWGRKSRTQLSANTSICKQITNKDH